MTTMTLAANTQPQAVTRQCRFCGAALERTFVDLGMSPLCETYPSSADLNRGEVYYPLHVYVCDHCFLVQLEQYESPEKIFSDYAYFSSYSDSWLKHAETYCDNMRWLLSQWDKHQYGFVVAGNHSVGRVLRVLFVALPRLLLSHVPCGYRFFKGFHDWMHQWLSGRPCPSLHGQIPDGAPTPTSRLDLKPGEYVRIKAQTEIEQTIDKNGRNRGLSFDPEEMAPYCGRVVQVHKSLKLTDFCMP